MPYPFRHRATFLVALFAMLTAACGNAAESGVNVKTIATDLTYGIPETPKPAPPPNTTTETTEDLGARLEGGTKDLPKAIPPPRGVKVLCPPPSPLEFPPPAPSEIAGLPKAGTYRWKTDGEQSVTGVGKVRLAPFVEREVTDVSSVNDGPKFTTVERELVIGSQYTVRQTYEYMVGEVDETEQGVNVDRTGLYLTKVERIHRSNKEANSTFTPRPPILVLPQPVELGDSVQSAGVDPGSLEVLRQTGNVTKRVRVNACGKPQDAFYVETIQEFVSADQTTTRRMYNYGIATVMGGLPIVEHVETPCVDSGGKCAKEAVTFLLDAHIGQLEPD